MNDKDWTALIPGAFGDGTFGITFASHELDKQRALQMLNAAIVERVGYETFCKTLREYIESKFSKEALTKVAVIDHIEKQMAKVRSVETLFLDD